MLPNREGRFKANILEHGVAETGSSKLATFICRFGLLEELVNNEWVAFGPEDMGLEIIGYFYLEKRDGSINTVTIDQLKAAFGWDGRDPLWLQDADLGRLVVQVKLEFELFEGKTRLKVRYVDAEDAAPAGVQKADEATRQSLGTRLGSKLRALAGGTPAASPTPAPAAQGNPSALPASPTASLEKTATMQQAWEAFTQECPKAWNRQDVETEWFRVLGAMFPGKHPGQLTPAQWHQVLTEAPGRILPI